MHVIHTQTHTQHGIHFMQIFAYQFLLNKTCSSPNIQGISSNWEDTSPECEKLDFREATALCVTEPSLTIGIISGEKDFYQRFQRDCPWSCAGPGHLVAVKCVRAAQFPRQETE